jgi:hypothetical protein
MGWQYTENDVDQRKQEDGDMEEFLHDGSTYDDVPGSVTQDVDTTKTKYGLAAKLL